VEGLGASSRASSWDVNDVAGCSKRKGAASAVSYLYVASAGIGKTVRYEAKNKARKFIFQ